MLSTLTHMRSIVTDKGERNRAVAELKRTSSLFSWSLNKVLYPSGNLFFILDCSKPTSIFIPANGTNSIPCSVIIQNVIITVKTRMCEVFSKNITIQTHAFVLCTLPFKQAILTTIKLFCSFFFFFHPPAHLNLYSLSLIIFRFFVINNLLIN